ncbi:MAG: hypothetical protein IJ781_00340 [Atopobiaceae bacterium]|nr:hypothetical protein [Atopobiaceae bacterium]
MSWQVDITIGEMQPWPDTVHVVRGKTNEKRRYCPERTASRVRVIVDEHGAVGHDECSKCWSSIGAEDNYCAHCGVRLEDA